jgi:hypothetical protein
MTITNIVNELIEAGLISERKTNHLSPVGRKPIGLEFSPEAPKILGVTIVRSGVEAVLCDLSLHVLKKKKAVLREYSEAGLLRLVFRLIDSLLDTGRPCSGHRTFLNRSGRPEYRDDSPSVLFLRN